MSDHRCDMTLARNARRNLRWTSRWAIALVGAALAGSATALPGDNVSVVRELASRVGPIVGSALACQDIGQPRIQVIADKFRAVIREVSSNEAERDDLSRLFDRYITDGRGAVTSGHTDCRSAARQLADLEQSLSGPSLAGVIGPSAAVAAPAPTAPAAPAAPAVVPAPVPAPVVAPPPATMAAVAPTVTQAVPLSGTNVHGVNGNEIRFGIVAPFSGSARELGRQMKLGIDTAFNRINDLGGIDGRSLRLVAADDGYEPTRTLDAMKQLYEKEQVFGYIGNVGTPTAQVAIPYALEHRALFFGAFTGSGILRNDPPDRYVFNYRASYAEETDAVVHYLIKIRRLQPRQIAVFAQQDSYGDAGYAGVAKAFRTLGVSDSAILRLGYKRNTVDVDDAVNQLKAQKLGIRAVVMVATYRAAAKFIEKTKDQYPGMIYSNVSFVGSTALADELMLLGSRYASGVIVTQVVPAVGGYSSAVLEYKNALAKYFPGEAPDYVSLEGYIAANVLIQALKKAGPQLDTERLIDTLENMRTIDLGLGAPLNFGRAEHQASHKIWGTAIDDNGKYAPVELE
jgi:branched-chain amino acid transport system substrate-binding protein